MDALHCAEADRLAEENEQLQTAHLQLTVENALLQRLPVITDHIIKQMMPVLWPKVRGLSGADARTASFAPLRAVTLDIARTKILERKKRWSRAELAITVHKDLLKLCRGGRAAVA